MAWRQLDKSDIPWRIYIGYGDDAATFVWRHSNGIYKDDYLKKTRKLSKSFMIQGCMSFKEPKEMAIMTSTI